MVSSWKNGDERPRSNLEIDEIDADSGPDRAVSRDWQHACES